MRAVHAYQQRRRGSNGWWSQGDCEAYEPAVGGDRHIGFWVCANLGKRPQHVRGRSWPLAAGDVLERLAEASALTHLTELLCYQRDDAQGISAAVESSPSLHSLSLAALHTGGLQP